MARSPLHHVSRARAIEFIRWQPPTPDPGFLAIAMADPNVVMLADDVADPAVLLVMGCWTGVGFIWGDACHESLVAANIAQLDAARRSGWCCFSAAKEWVAALRCTEARISDLARVSYSFDRQRDKCEPPPHFSVERVQPAAFSAIRDDLDPGFPITCPLPVHAMAIRHEDHYVSCAWGPEADGIVEIAAVTHPEFRRRGLGKIASTHLIDSLVTARLTPHASTNASNEPAKKWAVSVGFSRPVHHHWAVLAAKPQP